jgi:cell division transport system ATP-binding protein
MQALPPTLSGGEKQRAAIARAVIAKPNLLIADEPTGNVDPEIGRRLLRLFAEMNRMGTTVMIATHDIDLIQELDVRVLRIEQGRVFKGLNASAGYEEAMS